MQRATATAAPPARSSKAAGKRAAAPAKVATATTGEQIAKQLGQDILQGRYAPGQRVGEQAVAEAFALSRGPVRDALRILERQGLVEIRPRRGAYVVELALNDVADIFNVRCALLSLAVRYLARNPDKSALDEVEPRLAQLRKLALQKKPSLLDFAQATGRVAMGLLSACASAKVIQTTYRDLPHDALDERNGAGVDAQRTQAEPDEGKGHERLRRHLPADRDIEPVRRPDLHRPLDQPQH